MNISATEYTIIYGTLFFISWFGMMVYTEVNKREWYGDNIKSSDIASTYLLSFLASLLAPLVLPFVAPFYLFHYSIKLAAMAVKTFYKPEEK